MAAHLQVVHSTDSPADQLITEARRLTGLYCRECGFQPLPYMAREFARLLSDGYESQMLEAVIHRTSWAPRPSFAYFRAIIRNAGDRRTFREFMGLRKADVQDRDLNRSMDEALDALSMSEIEEILYHCH